VSGQQAKVRCPRCGGIDTRRYPVRGYAWCFVCELEIPIDKRESRGRGRPRRAAS
jgi:hypothetical protein